MSAADYQSKVYSTSFNINVDKMYQTSWVQLGNADKFGVPGTSQYCGAECKRNDFTIENTSD